MSAFLYFFRFLHFRITLFSKYNFRFPFHLSPFALFLILTSLTPDTIFAQQNFQWRNFTRIGDDLSSNNVRTITEDRFGQIWLGTDKGLSRLDGFWREAGRSNGGPQGADVFKVFEDLAGFIWVATDAGVYRGVWDRSRGQVNWLQHYNQQMGLIGIGARVLTMIQRQNGEIWIGTPLGVNRFDGAVWHSVADAEIGQLDQGVQVIYEDEGGDLWFGLSQSNRLQSGNLISRFNGVEWEIFSVNDGLPNGDVQTILEGRLGNLWIGTTAGAAVYDGSTWHVVTTQDGLLIGNNVQYIMSDQEATIWIGTTAGISQFRLPAQFSPAALRDVGRWRHLTRANGLASNNIQALFETRTGEIWVGTRDNGVNFSDRSWKSVTTDNGLSHNSVTAMLKDRQSRLWVGTRNGLSLYTRNGVELVRGTPGNEIRTLAEDLRGRIWVGTNTGIGVFDGVSWEVFRIPDINVNSVQSIVVDSGGDVWAGTGFLPTDDLPGLDRYDGEQWERNQFLEIDRTIVVMSAASRGRIYFGTVGNEEGGSDLWVYDGFKLNKLYSLPEPFSIHAILEVASGEIWVGTDTGIQIFDKETLNLTTSLTTTDGLADNRVQALYRDQDNRIWIGTADGVSLFRNDRFERTLTASDGLNSNNISAIAEVGGVLWFGSRGNGGLSIFSPEQAPPRTRIITEGPKNGEVVGETSLAFKFEGGDASTPAGELRYRYTLDDGPLIPTDDEGGVANSVLLSGLTEGPHRFTVYTIDREGNQDMTGASAEFVVDSLDPNVNITAPKENAVIGDIYEIKGTATDATDFLDYQIRIFPGNSVSGEPLLSFTSTVHVIGNTLYRWDTRTVAAGLYTIELVARDTPNGGFDKQHIAATSVTIEVDRVRPQVEILSPAENEQVPQKIEIRGTADDRNFKEYIIEYGLGESPDTWLPISKPPAFSNPVTRDILALWDAPNLSGLHTLRLIVEDTAGHKEFDQVHIFFNSSVNSEAGGVVKSHDNRAKITFPSNSLPRTTIVTVNPAAEESTPSAAPISFQAYDFAPEGLRLYRLKPATIQFFIEAAALSRSKIKETLTITRWDGKTWLPIGGTIDTQRGTISTVVSMLGRYTITTRPAIKTDEKTAISDLTCQPRVFSPSRESTWISFQLNHPDDITIKIYNEAGRLRRLLRESEPLPIGGHVFEWDGRDDEDRRVVSNFYIVTVEGEGALGTKVVVVQNN